MAEWTESKFENILPPDFQDLLDLTQSTTGTVVAILGTLQVAMEAIQDFIGGPPPTDLASALADAIDDFRNDFLGTGFFAANMWDYPLRQFFRSGSGGEPFLTSFVDDLAKAFTDTSDPNRPPFSTSAAMIVLVIGSDEGIEGLKQIFENIRVAFSWWREVQEIFTAFDKASENETFKVVEAQLRNGEIAAAAATAADKTKEVQRFKQSVQDFRDFFGQDELDNELDSPPATGATTKDIQDFNESVETSASVKSSLYPDFQQFSLRTFVPPLVDVVDAVFDPIIANLRRGRNIVQTVEDYIETLDAKITLLVETAELIDEFVQQLDDLLALTMAAVFITATTNGVLELRDELLVADNPPFQGFDNGLYSGIAIVAGGPSLNAFVNLFEPIGGTA